MTQVALVSLPAAMFAGLQAFVSPGILVLLPAYLAYLGAETLEEILDKRSTEVNRRAALAAGAVIVGFVTVFMLMGAGAIATGALPRRALETAEILGGVAVVLMGLHFIGAVRLPFVPGDGLVRVPKPPGLWGPYVMGAAFAFIWTPVIGPKLSAILSLAGSPYEVVRGNMLLAVYGLALALPLLPLALTMRPFVALLRQRQARFSRVERWFGVLLVITGCAFLTGTLGRVVLLWLDAMPALQRLG